VTRLFSLGVWIAVGGLALAQTEIPDEIPNEIELWALPGGTTVRFDQEVRFSPTSYEYVLQEGQIRNSQVGPLEQRGDLCTLRLSGPGRIIPAGAVYRVPPDHIPLGPSTRIALHPQSDAHPILYLNCQRRVGGGEPSFVGTVGTLARSFGWERVTVRDPVPPPYSHRVPTASELRTLPSSLPWTVGDPSLPPWSRAPYPFPRPTTLRLDGRAWGHCMARTILNYTRSPRIDRTQMSRPDDPNEVQRYLQGIRRIEPYTTGREEQLRQWVMRQPDASITPISILQASLELHSGNVWNALLGIHELLRNEARWFHRARYHYESTYAVQTDFFRRFIDIRGDLRERDRTRFTGDHSGSWYRIFGVLLGLLNMQGTAEWDRHFPQLEPVERTGTECPGISPTEEMLLEFQSFASQIAVTNLEASKNYALGGEEGAPFLEEGVPSETAGGAVEDDLRKAEYNRAAVIAGITMIESLFRLNEGNPFDPVECDHPETYLRELPATPVETTPEAIRDVRRGIR
jgi:hypothetical protein